MSYFLNESPEDGKISVDMSTVMVYVFFIIFYFLLFGQEKYVDVIVNYFLTVSRD